MRTGLTLVAAAAAALAAGRPARAAPAEPPPRFELLLFTRTAGYRHPSIPDGIRAVERLGREHGFGVVATEDPAAFDAANLARFAAVAFLNTTGDVLDDARQAAFEAYIARGGGFVGVHSAADTEYDWPWYGRLVGAYFRGHPAVQPARVLVCDPAHPSTRALPRRWERTDEWYTFRESPRGTVHVLATLDETTYQGGGMSGDHPIAWCHEFSGGRAWYTGGGHTSESFEEPEFLQHLLGGIHWAAGVAPGDAGATIDDRYEKVVLDDFVTDPMELAVAPDGRVVFVERGGIVKVWKPDTRATVTALSLDVFTALEDGLLGVALDPGFARTGWLYLYYAPADPEPRNRLSRFTMVGDVVDPASEVVLLEVATQRDECCHSGGSLAFDRHGNLYLSTGDNTSPFASDGFTPIDERPGRAPFDAQKSSSSTHDLRGKILRIRPEPDGTCTVPAGNLFPPDGSQGRPEIYVMGCRNPFRLSLHPRLDTLYWGEVGPDAGAAGPQRGPAGYDEFNRAAAAGNFGWPYFIGNNLRYHDYDFATRSAGAPFDPAAPRNESPNSAGRTELPPAQPAWMWYPYAPSDEFPFLGAGGRCAMAGPVYLHDAHGQDPRRLPAYYDNTLFLYEWERNWIMEVKLDESGEAIAVNRFLPGVRLVRPMDLELGPDGCLYLIEWGIGFGGGNPDARISRIEHYASAERPPEARAQAVPSSGPLPLTVRFSAQGSRSRSGGPVSLEWDFDGDGAVDSTESEPTHVYHSPGDYAARLTVRDATPERGVANLAISAGNTRPRVTFAWPPQGGVIDFGAAVDFRVEAIDDEDGPADADRVTVQPFLGHDTHAHPLQQVRGLRGTIVPLPRDGHGTEADLFGVLAASFTDRGGPAVAALAARAERILQPRLKQAEFAAARSGPRLEKSSDPDGGGAALVFQRAGDSAAYGPLCLHGIEAVTLRVATALPGCALELRLGGPEGPALGTARLDDSGGSLHLGAGLHPIRVEYFEHTGVAGLILRLEGPGLPAQPVPPAMLMRGGAHGLALPRGPGLDVAYYAIPDATGMPDFGALRPERRGVVQTIDVGQTSGEFDRSGRAEHVAAVYEGFLSVQTPGAYRPTLASDDGSRLYLDGTLVIDNDGLHAMTERSLELPWSDVTVPLRDPGGTHELHLVLRAPAGGEPLVKLNWLRFEGPGVAAAPGAEPAHQPHPEP